MGVFPLVAALFFLSGAAALVYQVAWLRILSLVFGVTIYAASAVLTSFMGGLALGSWLGGRSADRVHRPLHRFALLEFGIAISALSVPFVLDAAAVLYADLHRRAPDALAQITAVRLICSSLVLLLPTALMGASLPLLARYVARSGGFAPGRIGWLYAVNTAGGIAGTAFAGFILIGAIGITATTWVAAAINLAVGCCALVLSRMRPVSHQDVPSLVVPAAGAAALPRVVIFIVVVSGFGGLALEVVWFRLLTLFLTTTTYAFTTMLSTILSGIALGSAVAALRVRRSSDPARALAWMQIWIGVLVLLSMTTLAHTYRIGWRTSGMIQACVVAMLPAATLMGATFPFAVAVALRDSAAAVGRSIGLMYALNVCGAVVGALVGGFVLVPLLGARTSLLLLAAVYVACGCIVLWTAAETRPVIRPLLAAAALFAAAAVSLADIHSAVLARRYEPGERLVFLADGAQTTVMVNHRPPDRRVLYLDGLHQANDSAEMVRVHAEIGQLPMALHPNPRRALIVGVGGGVTAGAVAAHPETSVDVVELSRSVLSALPYFGHVNGNVIERPNVRLRVDDGRNYLQWTPRRYDVVTADLIQPIHAGAGNLYSVEYFTLARSVLSDGGLVMQWIGRRQEAHYKLIMRTFLRAFPHATVWSSGELLVGSVRPLRISRSAFDARLADPRVRSALASADLTSFDALLDRYTAGPDEMRAFVGDGPVLTDDRPLLEFYRSVDGRERVVDISALRGDVRRHVVAVAGDPTGDAP